MEYATDWGWFIQSGYCYWGGDGGYTDHYYWYLFRNNGTLYVSGNYANCNLHQIHVPGNDYYWKEYNHTGDTGNHGGAPSHTLSFYVAWWT